MARGEPKRRSTRLLSRALTDFGRRLDAVVAAPTERNVHALRVASRRARAAIRRLGRARPPRLATAIRRFFARLSRSSGPVRDLDVFASMQGDRLDAATRGRWKRASAAARAALIEQGRQFILRWRELAAAILALGGSRRKRVESRWARHAKAAAIRLDRASPYRSKDASYAIVHAFRRLARRIRYEAEVVREFGLEDSGLAARAKRIHRATAEAVDLTVLSAVAARLGAGVLAKELRKSSAAARAALRPRHAFDEEGAGRGRGRRRDRAP